jgi:hypothetical protein
MRFIYSATLAGLLVGGLFAGTCHRSPFSIFDIASDDRGIVIIVYGVAVGLAITGMAVAFFAQFGMTVGRTKVAAVSRRKGWVFIACVAAYFVFCWILSQQFCS